MDSLGLVLEKRGFGTHNSSDGLQSICFTCKNIANNKARDKNIVARVRHHTATRCLTQLGPLVPEGFTRDMEDYLGYKITALVRHLGAELKDREGSHRKLRDALHDGYHIDHVRPLSSFSVVTPNGVDWDAFRCCWTMTNLKAIPGAENLAKGARYDECDECEETPRIDTSNPGQAA